MSKKEIKTRIAPTELGLPCTGADSHAHLDSEGLFDQLPAIMERAQAAGVAVIGQIFLSPAAYRSGRAAFAPYPHVYFVQGIHPCEAQMCTESVLAEMREAFQQDPRLRAVGEIGLDFYWEDCPHAIQEAAFRKQLALARELNLPVVIHSRDAAEDSLRILEAEGWSGRPVLWHCFSGDAVQHIERILAHGWFISVPGPVTYPANTALRDVLPLIPAERLLVETDCPYLSPVPWRGKPNEPALVAFTAVEVARARGEDPAELWTRCGQNTRRFFGLPEQAGLEKDGTLP